MSSRAIFSTLVMFLAVPLCFSLTFDWREFTARSDRTDDAFLVSALEDGDFETRAAVCAAIGRRAEPDAQAVLSWLQAGYSTEGVFQAEHLLRLALVSLFDSKSDEQSRAARFAANAPVLADIAQSVGTLRDPQLRGAIVRILPGLDRSVGLRALMETGAEILESLRRTGGHLSSPETSLAFDYLGAVKAMGTADFFDPCLEISRLSRDKGLVASARAAASAVSGTRR